MIEIGTQTHSKEESIPVPNPYFKETLTKSKKKRKKERRDHLV
jgi:hypothetical protein